MNKIERKAREGYKHTANQWLTFKLYKFWYQSRLFIAGI